MRQPDQTTAYRAKQFWRALFLLLAAVAANVYAEAQEALAAEYQLGTGDKIQIDVYDEPDLSISTTISPSGNIAYPFLGDLKVTALTLKQLEQLLVAGLKGAYLADPQVRVTIVEYRPVFVSGAVQQSGGYPYQPGLTVRKAVSLAGGLTSKASSKKITLIRETDKQKGPVPVALDDLVGPGDTIIIGQGFF